MENKKILHIVENRKIFFIISAVLISLTILFSFILGVEVDIEFKGGNMITYGFVGEVDLNKASDIVQDIVGKNVSVTEGSSLNDQQKTMAISYAADEKIDDDLLLNITDSLKKEFADNEIKMIDRDSVTPSSGFSFLMKCLVAVIFSFILLVIYIAFRFKKISGWSAGVVAVICLIHDVVIVYATFVFFRLPLNSNFMAAVLTILGYSINNTIIIYDRIRENRTLYGKKMDNTKLVNLSITQTFTRSLNTSISTLIAMVVVTIVALVMQVDSIVSFSLPLAVGIIVGFYTSTCLAGSLWTWWQSKTDNKTRKAR